MEIELFGSKLDYMVTINDKHYTVGIIGSSINDFHVISVKDFNTNEFITDTEFRNGIVEAILERGIVVDKDKFNFVKE